MQVTTLSVIYLLTTLLTISLALVIYFRRSAPGSLPFAVFLLGVAGWVFANSLALTSTDPFWTNIWFKCVYISIASLAPAWLRFALEYTGRREWLTAGRWAIMLVFPAATVLIALTNDFHYLIWLESDLVEKFGKSVTATHGPWFWINIIYSYAVILAGVYILIHSISRYPRSYRNRIWPLVVALAIPGLGNLIYISGFSPMYGLDITPLTFSLVGVIYSVVLFRQQIFELIPIARDTLIDHMVDGMIVLDSAYQIMDINETACGLLASKQKSPIGQPIQTVLGEYFAQMVKAFEGPRNQTEIYYAPQNRWLEIRAANLEDAGRKFRGRLVILRDITQRKNAEQAEQDQRNLAEALRDTAILLTNTLQLDEVLARILANVDRVVPHDSANIMLIDPYKKSASFVLGRGYAERGLTEQPAPVRLLLETTPTLQKMARTNLPVVIPDTSTAGWVKTPTSSWVKSYVGAPIRVKGDLFGFINLHSTVRNFYTSDHAERLNTFAAQAGVAIENARLFAETARRAELMEISNRIGTAIASGLNLKQVIQAIYEQCKRAIPSDVFYLAIYDEVSQTVRFPLYYYQGQMYESEILDLRRNPGLTGYVLHHPQKLDLWRNREKELN